MTQTELYQALKTLGMPVAYHHFAAPPSPPYMVYLVADADAYGSDERNEIRLTRYIIELYTKYKDPTSQELIETMLDSKGIPYTLYEQHVDSENLYQAAYHIEFTTKIRRV